MVVAQMGSIRTTVFTSSTSVSVASRHLLGSAAGSSLMAAWSRKLQYQIKHAGKPNRQLLLLDFEKDKNSSNSIQSKAERINKQELLFRVQTE